MAARPRGARVGAVGPLRPRPRGRLGPLDLPGHPQGLPRARLRRDRRRHAGQDALLRRRRLHLRRPAGTARRPAPARAHPGDPHRVSDLFSLAGRTALVTGGSRGIGAAIATEFLNAGARVIVCARKAPELEATVARLGELGTCEGVPADLSTVTGAEAL